MHKVSFLLLFDLRTLGKVISRFNFTGLIKKKKEKKRIQLICNGIYFLIEKFYLNLQNSKGIYDRYHSNLH